MDSQLRGDLNFLIAPMLQQGKPIEGTNMHITPSIWMLINYYGNMMRDEEEERDERVPMRCFRV